MPMDLADLLADTLAAEGFEVEQTPPLEGRSGATYPAHLVAERDGERLLVDVIASDPVDGSDLEALDAVVADTGVDGALLLALADEAEEVGGAHENVEVWPRPTVARRAGAALLSQAVQASDPESIGPSPADGEPTTADPDTPTSNTGPRAAARSATGDNGAELLNGDASSTEPAADPAPAPEPDADRGPRAEPEPEAEPSPSPDRQGDPQTQSQDPAAAEPADPEPEPAPESRQGGSPDADDLGPEGGGFLDPEEMVERAEKMANSGDLPEDGDAELLTDDPDRQPEAQGSPGGQAAAEGGSGTQAPGQPDPDAQPAPQDADPQPAPDSRETEAQPDGPDAMEEGQVFEEADAELLPSKPRDERESQGEPQTQEPATGQGASGAEPATDPGSQATTGSPAGSGEGGSSPLAAAAPTETTEETAFLSGGCVPPRVTEDEALIAAEDVVFEADEARLELLPFHVFDYACRLEGDGAARDEDDRVWVSAQSGAVVEAPQDDLVEDPGRPNERFQGELGARRAADRAEEDLLASLGRREELREDHSETAVIERVRLEPNPDTLALEHLGKAYAPRWRVEGTDGTVFVDALTGDLVSG
jgi:hypothetical protein